MTNLIPAHINNIAPYRPGLLIEEVAAQHGLTKITKLASNENNLGPSPKVLAAINEALPNIHRYGDMESRFLKSALAHKFDLSQELILIGNGSSEFLLTLAHGFLGPGLNAIMSQPSFSLYAQNTKAAGADAIVLPLKPDFNHDLEAILAKVTEQTRLIFLDNPLNPTGGFLEPQEIETFFKALPEHVILVLDEAYIDFARRKRQDWQKLIKDSGRLVVLRTFSKAYALAGLRVAYALMPLEILTAINKVRQPFNLNNLAQVAAIAALDDDEFYQKTLDMTWNSLDYMQKEMKALGFNTYPTEANFMMVEVEKSKGRSADVFFNDILKQGFITRSLTSFGLPTHLRINAGTPEETRAFVDAVRKVL